MLICYGHNHTQERGSDCRRVRIYRSTKTNAYGAFEFRKR